MREALLVDDLRYASMSDGAQIAYRVFSENRGPTIVYVPGLMYSMESIADDPPYAQFIDGLSDFGRLVIVERQGIGLSDPLPADGDVYDRWAENVMAVLEDLGVESVSLFGYGLGANVVLDVGCLVPEGVDRVVALNPMFIPEEVATPLRESTLRVVEGDDLASDEALNIVSPSRSGDAGYRDWNLRAGRLSASRAMATRIWDAVLRPSTGFERLGAADVDVVALYRREFPSALPELFVEGTKTFSNVRVAHVGGTDLIPNSGDVDELLMALAEALTDESNQRGVSRPLTALLFTDIVDSTGEATAAGDADWREVLNHHDRLIDRSLRRFGGTVVKATGDGALATFATPSLALKGAAVLRDELSAAGLRLRLGVHLGEIEVRGDDVAGLAVHLAARVMAAADSGEILVTDAVRLATLGGPFEFESRGATSLKGFDEPFQLYRLGDF